MRFQLAACAETLWQNKPVTRRAERLCEMGNDGPVGLEAFATLDPKAALDAFHKVFTL